MTEPARVPKLSELDPKFAEHLRVVAGQIASGSVVPVLGAGANLCDRKTGDKWIQGANLPNGAELSQWLAAEYNYPVTNLPNGAELSEWLAGEDNHPLPDRTDLLKVSQFADITVGEGGLYQSLDKVFLPETYPIPSLHTLLASLPRRTGHPLLIVTTNYDDLMERALLAADPPIKCHVVRYLANGAYAGRFVHAPPDGKEKVVTRPNTYKGVDPEVHTVVLKIHGTIVRKQKRQDSYVITEDHYIEYLSRANPSQLIPAGLLDKLVNGNLLFLGYGMRDWNLRVMLHHILELRKGVDWKAWAVQHQVDDLDEVVWRRRSVDLHQYLLSDYIGGLEATLRAHEAARKAAIT